MREFVRSAWKCDDEGSIEWSRLYSCKRYDGCISFVCSLVAVDMSKSSVPSCCVAYSDVSNVAAIVHSLDRHHASSKCSSTESTILVSRYTGHYFVSTLLYSIFLGVVAVDRFCLGYTAIAVGKLMTLGGLGIWWLVDIVSCIIDD